MGVRSANLLAMTSIQKVHRPSAFGTETPEESL